MLFPLIRHIPANQQVLFLQQGSCSYSQTCIHIHLPPALGIPSETAHQNILKTHEPIWWEEEKEKESCLNVSEMMRQQNTYPKCKHCSRSENEWNIFKFLCVWSKIRSALGTAMKTCSLPNCLKHQHHINLNAASMPSWCQHNGSTQQVSQQDQAQARDTSLQPANISKSPVWAGGGQGGFSDVCKHLPRWLQVCQIPPYSEESKRRVYGIRPQGCLHWHFLYPWRYQPCS